MNKLTAVLFAARPKTLPAAMAPVLLGSSAAAAIGKFDWLPAVLAFLFAIFAQVACNLANDYGDFIKGADTKNRLGPDRATAKGWLSPVWTLAIAFLFIFLSAISGLGLICWGGWEMLIVGIVSLIACLAYTLGPLPLAYNGLGDIFVILFFGIVAVSFTCYVQAGEFPSFIWFLAFICGLGANNILLINNIRDRETDAIAKKRTTVVLFGEKFGLIYYKLNLIIIFCSPLILRYFFGFNTLCILLPMLILSIPMGNILKYLRIIKVKTEYNLLLGESAKFLILYAISQSIGLFLSYNN